MSFKRIISMFMLIVISLNILVIEAGIVGYHKLYNPKAKVYVNIVYDMHVPYVQNSIDNKNSKNSISWLEQFHPCDREFFNILQELDKKQDVSLSLVWEGYPEHKCFELDPFIIKSGAKLYNDLENIDFTYSDTHRIAFAKALHTFLDMCQEAIAKDLKLQDIREIEAYKKGQNILEFIYYMSKKGYDKELKNLKTTFLNRLKKVIFRPFSKSIYNNIKNKYGIKVAKELKDYYDYNRSFWRDYYNKHMLKFENKDLKYFIEQKGIRGLVNLPYNSEICRSLKPYDKLDTNMFYNYQEVFDIQALANILNSNKNNIILYAGAAHCQNIALALNQMGFKTIKNTVQHNDFSKFLNPLELQSLKSL